MSLRIFLRLEATWSKHLWTGYLRAKGLRGFPEWRRYGATIAWQEPRRALVHAERNLIGRALSMDFRHRRWTQIQGYPMLAKYYQRYERCFVCAPTACPGAPRPAR